MTKNSIIQFIKVLYSYFFNGLKLFRFKKVRRHLMVNEPKSITIGNNSRLGGFCRLESYNDENGRLGQISLGNYTSIGNYCTILCGSDVNIGDFPRFA